MADYSELKEVYRRVRSHDDELNDLLDLCERKMDEFGDYALYRDMGVSEEMIRAFVSYREFELWMQELKEEEGGERDEDEDKEEDGNGEDEVVELSYATHDTEDSSAMNVEEEDSYQHLLLYEATDSQSSDDDDSSMSSLDESQDRNLEREERKIAKQIHKLCDAFGSEPQRHLNRTAQYLLDLGEIYRGYSKEVACSKMDSKLNFIRAAALMNAVIARYDILKDQNGIQNAVIRLKSLHQQLLSAAGALPNTSEDLVLFSKAIKTRVGGYRKQEAELLAGMSGITKKARDQPLTTNDEKHLIHTIRSHSIGNTTKYQKLMTDIVKKCLKVMGQPPCEFTIVGLGSLARQEITLSSDFEHVIILDDGARDTEDVREYFRWFTVIFQVIIVGLGETIIPSIDIKSLCNHYSSDNNEKWFKDVHTPCGISFDGMMPHACKTPLGWQQPTTDRDYVLELIQPALVMSSFLTKQQDDIYGYTLQDILGTACFVYGNRQVYEAFLNDSARVKKSFTPLELFLQHRDVLTTAIDMWHSSRYESSRSLTSVKKTIYRPMTVLLHILARHFELTSLSSFDIIDEMKSKNYIDDQCHHSLCLAMAAILEARMRNNQTRHQQRNAITEQDIVEMIGQERLVTTRVTIQFLVYAVQDQMYRTFRLDEGRSKLAFPSEHEDLWQCEVVRSCPFIGNINQIALHLLTSIDATLLQYSSSEGNNFGRTYYFLKIYFELLSSALGHITGNDAYHTNSFKLLSRHESREPFFWSCDVLVRFGTNVNNQISFMVQKSYALFYDENYCDAVKILENCVEACKEEDNIIPDTFAAVGELEMSVKSQVLKPQDAIQYFEAAPKPTFLIECMHRIGIAKAFSRLNRKDRSCTILSEIVSDAVENANKLSPRLYGELLRLIAFLLEEYGHRRDAYRTVDLFHNTRDCLLPGSYLDSKQYTTFHSLEHYKYNFGRRWNVGKYSNFTFSLKYERPLTLVMVDIKYYNAIQLFSTLSYGDTLTLVKYTLSDSIKLESIPQSSVKLWNAAQAIAIMVLCEQVRQCDIGVLTSILNRCSLAIRLLRILQPFAYACFKEFHSNPLLMDDIIPKQNALFQQLFPTRNMPSSFKKAVTSFTNLNFTSSVKITWKLLHLSADTTKSQHHCETMLKYFITNVLTVMVVRKRTEPLPFFKKCQELSLKQTLWLHCHNLDESHRDFLASQFLDLSGFYELSNNRMSILYNLAVDCLVYDSRTCAALIWKLIYSNKLKDDLVETAYVLLCAALDRICAVTLKFTNVSRVI